MEKTRRGFSIKHFIDRCGNTCSIQKSSIATEDAIWFGVDVIYDSGKETVTGVPLVARMHLTQDMVIELLPLLQHFAETGKLEELDK